MEPLRHHTNETTSGILHLIGSVCSVTILILLIIFSFLYGNAWHIVGFTVFGIFLSTLYLASSVYHLTPQKHGRTKEILQRIDHASVYFLIAGTYTPVCFLMLKGSIGWSVFAVLWSLTIFGAVLKLVIMGTDNGDNNVDKIMGTATILLHFVCCNTLYFSWTARRPECRLEIMSNHHFLYPNISTVWRTFNN